MKGPLFASKVLCLMWGLGLPGWKPEGDSTLVVVVVVVSVGVQEDGKICVPMVSVRVGGPHIKQRNLDGKRAPSIGRSWYPSEGSPVGYNEEVVAPYG